MIEFIPFGKENKINRWKLMKKANLNLEEFKQKISELREQYIIISDSSDGGYWRPNSKEELQEFIKKYQSKNYDTSKIIMLAYKEMEEIEENDDGFSGKDTK